MRLTVALWGTLSMLISAGGHLGATAVQLVADHGQVGQPVERRPPPQQVAPSQGGVVDVNRPRTPFDCELPLGEQWYGSQARCLAYLCAGRNVYNEYIFDSDNRRRRNPCYGQSPTDFPD